MAQLEQAAGLAAQAAPSWLSIGPAPILGFGGNGFNTSGRVTSIAVDPSAPDHWLLGAAEGGVWETFNATCTTPSGSSCAVWLPLTDDKDSLAIGAVAFGTLGAAYAGTGELNGDGFFGIGLLKSSDSGQHWQLVAGAPFLQQRFSGIVVDPANPSTVVVATSNGIYRSTNGGSAWPPLQ